MYTTRHINYLILTNQRWKFKETFGKQMQSEQLLHPKAINCLLMQKIKNCALQKLNIVCVWLIDSNCWKPNQRQKEDYFALSSDSVNLISDGTKYITECEKDGKVRIIWQILKIQDHVKMLFKCSFFIDKTLQVTHIIHR